MAKVQNQEKWGKSTAKERYGSATGGISGPSQEAPQCPEDKRGPDYDNSTPSNWLRGMPNAEGKPGFDHSTKGK